MKLGKDRIDNTVDRISTEYCTGCKVCGDICPKAAISFPVDKEGFWYPRIDAEKCISCGKCLNICPVSDIDEAICQKATVEEIPTKDDRLPLQAFAAWNADDEIRRESTSGGLFQVFASQILSQGGFLVGSAYTDDYKSACHMTATDADGLKRLMGSKYFQSDTEGIYKETKELLKTGKPVLFVGTPCQVAGLYSYLKGRPENLYTVDFICRGVSSPLLQKEKIEYYERLGGSKVTLYRDKYKKYAWIDFGARICYANGKERFVSRWRDEILHCFIQKNFSMRKSCYACPFKLGKIHSDITIGDFWGIDGVTEKDLRDGVSALMANTTKGLELIQIVSDNLYLMKKPLERVYKNNQAYVLPPDRPGEREDFYEVVLTAGLDAALKKYRDFRSETPKQKRRRERRMRCRPYLFIKEDFTKIRWRDFIYYNYFCKAVIREKGAFLIPYKGAVISIHPEARLHLKGNALINYYPYYKKGKQTTLLQLGKGAQAYLNNRIELAYGTTLSVAEGAVFKAGYFTTMINTNIICRRKMTFGNNIMFGRDICVFDSDYHPIYNERFEHIDSDQETIIEDNVWVGTKSMILKGSCIRQGAIIGADSLVSGEVGAENIYVNKRQSLEISGPHIWER